LAVFIKKIASLGTIGYISVSMR